MNPVHEIAQYRLLPGIPPDRLKAALAPLHAWLAAQPGCLAIHSILHEDGLGVSDHLAWRSKDEATAANAATEHHESLQALLPLVQPDSFSCAYGTLLLETRP